MIIEPCLRCGATPVVVQRANAYWIECSCDGIENFPSAAMAIAYHNACYDDKKIRTAIQKDFGVTPFYLNYDTQIAPCILCGREVSVYTWEDEHSIQYYFTECCQCRPIIYHSKHATIAIHNATQRNKKIRKILCKR
jgi:hypothetical protein